MFRPTRSSRPSPVRHAVLLIAVLAVVLALPWGGGAQAQDALDQRRIAGVVGERFDGLLVPREGATAADVAFIDNVNGQRRQVYQQQAAAQGVSVEAVSQIYAQEILQAAPSGTWFLNSAGQWTRK